MRQRSEKENNYFSKTKDRIIKSTIIFLGIIVVLFLWLAIHSQVVIKSQNKEAKNEFEKTERPKTGEINF